MSTLALQSKPLFQSHTNLFKGPLNLNGMFAIQYLTIGSRPAISESCSNIGLLRPSERSTSEYTTHHSISKVIMDIPCIGTELINFGRNIAIMFNYSRA